MIDRPAELRRTVRVAIVEDQPLYRQMLEALIRSAVGFTLAGSASSAAEAARLDAGAVDVALVDLFLPDGSGVSVGVELRGRNPGLAVVLISANDAVESLLDADDVQRHRWSFLSKTGALSAQSLVAVVRAAASGRAVVDPELVRRRRARSDGPVSALTPRQFEVLSLIAEGLSNREMADRLGLSRRSIDNHVNSVYEALAVERDGSHNPRAQAVRIFVEGSR